MRDYSVHLNVTWMDHRPQLCLRNLFFPRNETDRNQAATADEYQQIPNHFVISAFILQLCNPE